jgi:hypothetical protein
MLSYLSKFVLQMLPTISATVIGAYIVTTWINPKAQPERVKVATPAQPAAKASPVAPVPDAAAAEAKSSAPDRAASGSAEIKPAEVKLGEAAEGAKPVKAAKGPDNIRIIPIVKQPAPATDVAATTSTPETVPAADDRKDATELARAAIQRLRGGSETERAAGEPARPPAHAGRVQQARAAAEAPQSLPPPATVASAPPLPPAVSIAAPRYPEEELADQAPLAQAERLTPPGEIPVERNPLSIQASHRVAETPSLADDFLSATKSFFRAITPPSQ